MRTMWWAFPFGTETQEESGGESLSHSSPETSLMSKALVNIKEVALCWAMRSTYATPLGPGSLAPADIQMME